MEVDVVADEDDGDAELTTPPSSAFTLFLPYEEWKKIESGMTELPKNQPASVRRQHGNRIWMSILIPQLQKMNPICGLSARSRHLRILRPELEDNDRGSYASGSVVCIRGECTVSYSIRVARRPVAEEMVRVEVELAKGDPLDHIGDDGLSVDTYRGSLTSDARRLKRESLRGSHKTLIQFSQDVPADVEERALKTGNYSAIPNTGVVRSLQREIATEDRLDKDPVLELVKWRQKVLEEEGEPTVKCALRGHIQESRSDT